MAKTVGIKKITREVRKLVGMGLPQRVVERIVQTTIREMLKSLLEGNRVKLGKITLSAKVIDKPTKKQYRNPQTGEKIEKVIEPHIQLRVNPKRIELEKKDEILKAI